MAGDYRKYSVEMKGGKAGYRLWKRGRQNVVCIFESYREKRSVFFSASNLLPSSVLFREEGREYHLILLGSSDGKIIHMDFGELPVNPRGECLLRKKFTGAPLSCYTHCLLAALSRETGDAETVFEGVMPFSAAVQNGKPEEKEKAVNGEYREKGEGGLPEEDSCSGEKAGKRRECSDEAEKTLFQRNWGSIFQKYYKEPFTGIFTEEQDETGALWCRVSGEEMLPGPLYPCRKLIEKYGHYIIGKAGSICFAGIPGRFLRCEQPEWEEGRFSLWQPIRGGEHFFSGLSELTGALQEEIYGYWICGIDETTGALRAV